MRRTLFAILSSVCLAAAACGGPAPSDSATPSGPPAVTASSEVEETPAARAPCNRRAYEDAISSNIDAGSFPFDVIGCDGRHMSLRVDLGAGACPPEATKEQRRRCARPNTAYFVAGEDGWVLLAYESRTSCESVRSVDESFPTELCRA